LNDPKGYKLYLSGAGVGFPMASLLVQEFNKDVMTGTVVSQKRRAQNHLTSVLPLLISLQYQAQIFVMCSKYLLYELH
jgi:hypothetical protein